MEDHFGNTLVIDTGGEKPKCKFCGEPVMNEASQWHKHCAENQVLAIVRESSEEQSRLRALYKEKGLI